MGTALVLGSGGITGIAWTLGVLSTWPHSACDLVVGTSAGAFAGALDGNPAAFAHACDAMLGADHGSAKRDLARGLGNRLPHLLAVPGRRGDALVRAWMVGAVARRFAASAGSGRAALGAAAAALRRQLAALPLDDAGVRAIALLAVGRRTAAGPAWVQYWHDQLAGATWPAALRIVAIDGRTGMRHVFDRDSGVPLARAVAASTAIPALVGAVPIGDSAYFDAGVADTTSADLAAGHERVVVLVPNPRPPLEDHLRMLRATGAEVVTVLPGDLGVLGAGQRRLDAAGQPASFELGRQDGRAIPA